MSKKTLALGWRWAGRIDHWRGTGVGAVGACAAGGGSGEGGSAGDGNFQHGCRDGEAADKPTTAKSGNEAGGEAASSRRQSRRSDGEASGSGETR